MKKNAPVESLSFFRTPHLPGVEIMSADANNSVWKVFHEDFRICTVETSPLAAHWRYRKSTHHTLSGHNMLMEPGELHVNLHPVSGRFHVTTLLGETVDRYHRRYGIGKSPHLKLANAPDPDFFRSMLRFLNSMKDGAPLLEMASWFEIAMSIYFGRFFERSKALREETQKGFLRKAKDLLVENSSENVSLEELSSEAHLSPFHFLRSFAKEFGMPPHAFQIRVRVAKARSLLAKGLPIKNLDVGFSDQSHLNRFFKKIYGITPGKYVEALQKSRFVGFSNGNH